MSVIDRDKKIIGTSVDYVDVERTNFKLVSSTCRISYHADVEEGVFYLMNDEIIEYANGRGQQTRKTYSGIGLSEVHRRMVQRSPMLQSFLRRVVCASCPVTLFENVYASGLSDNLHVNLLLEAEHFSEEQCAEVLADVDVLIASAVCKTDLSLLTSRLVERYWQKGAKEPWREMHPQSVGVRHVAVIGASGGKDSTLCAMIMERCGYLVERFTAMKDYPVFMAWEEGQLKVQVRRSDSLRSGAIFGPVVNGGTYHEQWQIARYPNTSHTQSMAPMIMIIPAVLSTIEQSSEDKMVVPRYSLLGSEWSVSNTAPIPGEHRTKVRALALEHLGDGPRAQMVGKAWPSLDDQVGEMCVEESPWANEVWQRVIQPYHVESELISPIALNLEISVLYMLLKLGVPASDITSCWTREYFWYDQSNSQNCNSCPKCYRMIVLYSALLRMAEDGHIYIGQAQREDIRSYYASYRDAKILISSADLTASYGSIDDCDVIYRIAAGESYSAEEVWDLLGCRLFFNDKVSADFLAGVHNQPLTKQILHFLTHEMGLPIVKRGEFMPRAEMDHYHLDETRRQVIDNFYGGVDLWDKVRRDAAAIGVHPGTESYLFHNALLTPYESEYLIGKEWYLALHGAYTHFHFYTPTEDGGWSASVRVEVVPNRQEEGLHGRFHLAGEIPRFTNPIVQASLKWGEDKRRWLQNIVDAGFATKVIVETPQTRFELTKHEQTMEPL